MKVVAGWLGLLVGLLLPVECLAVGSVAPEFTLPTYTGAYEPQGVDERGLWMQLDELERSFRDNPGVLHDPMLEQWLRAVLCRTVGQERCGSVRIYIVQDSSFNASMSPNGLMVVHTGLLARLHSEAELALVLGHEFAHFELRHTLNLFRQARRSTDIMAWLAISSAATGVNSSATQNGLVLGIIGFGRAQETSADELGAKYVLASPYALKASEVWQRATDEQNALRAERGLKKIKKNLPDLADLHPTDKQRFVYFAKLEAEAGVRGEQGVEAYRKATSAVLPTIFGALVRRNDFAGTDYVIRGRGEALGWDAQLLFTRGELFRLRGSPRDLMTARDLFGEAIAKADAPPEAWRGLGLVAMRLGDRASGITALEEYLKRAPNAVDRSTIAMLTKE